MKFLKTHKLTILLLLLLSIPVILPLFKNGFFQSDDGEWMIIRFSAFHQSLRDGQIPARFLSRLNNEYGYPVANFLYPGFMYFAEIIKILGFGFVDTIKIIFGIALIESFIFTFFWLTRLFNKQSAFVGALIYLYAPYHLFDAYHRGSIGEVVALAVVPFILWQLERKSFYWTSLGIAMLILSHNTLALLFMPIIVIYMVIVGNQSLIINLYSLILGIGIAAFFWLTALFDLKYTIFSQTTVSSWSNYFADISLIGVSIFLVFATSAYLILKKNSYKNYSMFMAFFILGLISLFFSTSLSSFLWPLLPVSFVQFPFRFLSIVILCASFLTAYFLSNINQKYFFISSLIFVIVITFSAKDFIMPKVFFNKGEGFYATNMGTTTVKNEYMPLWVKQIPTERPKNIIEVIKGKGEISNSKITAKTISFKIDMQENGVVRVNKIYFPGFVANVDNTLTSISYINEFGVMDIEVSSGKHIVDIAFKETPVRIVADIISVVSLLVLLLFVYTQRKK